MALLQGSLLNNSNGQVHCPSDTIQRQAVGLTEIASTTRQVEEDI
jgi:hypothetical protein